MPSNPPPPRDDAVTDLLSRAGSGDTAALDRLLPLVYADLKAIAANHMRGERTGHTLDTTALVHESYVRLVDQDRVEWKSRAHFFAIASQAMRRILVSHARAKNAAKRGGGAVHVPLDQVDALLPDEQAEELLALDEALERLSHFNPRGADVVTYRFFGGMEHAEIARAMGLSEPTVRRAWTAARSWLGQELRGGGALEGAT